jgi:DNA modification methylase
MNYQEFLQTKQKDAINAGFKIDDSLLSNVLFDFQAAIVKWALARGRAAIFAGTGLGKTAMQIEWAKHVCFETGKNVLIVAPLSVAHQTVREANDLLSIKVNYCREQDQVSPGLNITNYEMLDKFDMDQFIGIVLDESSILKHQQGKVRTQIIESTKSVPYKLSCTATPAPNDHMELGSQCEFLGIMTAIEMLAMFFVHDGGETSKWRLKGHAKYKFWEWMAGWSVFIQSPEDLGFDGAAYQLPPLNIIEHRIETNIVDDGLFTMPAQGLSERRKASRKTLDQRCDLASQIVNDSDENFIVWCYLNDESDQLKKQINDSEDVKGSYTIERKEKIIDSFSDGTLSNLISKPSITGFGLNWQHINNVVFVGLNDSWESFYQAVRRCYRFGQKKQVNVHIITTDLESSVLNNIKRKEDQAKIMMSEMAHYMANFTKRELKGITMDESNYVREVSKSDKYEIHHADCVDLASEIENESIDYTIYSPPFESLYTYSNSDRDMGNSKDTNEFWNHYKFLIKEHYRITKPGRLVSVHCMNLPTSKVRDGQIGLRDFRGEIIRQFKEVGFIYHSEVAIWKDPVVAMQRTKALGLLHKQIKKDSAMSRMGLPDYVVTFRKPGENKDPISHTPDEFPVTEWQQIASPIWMDIKQSNTLQYRQARDNNDERHIAPLQLDVISRCLKLWSNPGDLVFSPFTGIGSEGYMSVKMDRRFIGSELKKSYYDIAVKNLFDATEKQTDLFKDVS